jgi:2-succinyl-6-hydroxy-2,4-cyclohexadiene-1-carboxylate synthase
VPEDVVLLHGFTQTGASWKPVIRALGARYRALAPDLRGHGTAADRRPVTFDAVMADLDALVAPGALLAGYSMGGRIALTYALARPKRVARLVLVGSSPGLQDPTERAQRRAADNALAKRVEQIGVPAFARAWGAQPLFADQPPEIAAAAHEDRLRHTPAGLAAALRGLGTGTMEPLWERLGELRIPVTVAAGERDARFLALAQRMEKAIAGARIVTIPGAGHAAQLEQPEAVAALLRSPQS